MREATTEKHDRPKPIPRVWVGTSTSLPPLGGGRIVSRFPHVARLIKWTAWCFVHCALCLIATACANIGSPEGGPRDYNPPRVLRTSPQQGALNVKGNKVEIVFDEIVNIKDQQKKVVVSPVQKEPALIRALGKKVTVEFRDTLQASTTYVVDFTNAIEDNNEGNPLDGYAFSFSTGADIDTLRVSGIVLRASDLEPMQHVIVGLHSNLNDSAFTRLPLERITRTNDRGQFTIMGLRPGRYRVYALNDVDGDYRMARTEDIAFFDQVVEPTAQTFTSQDTVFTYDHRIDTVAEGMHTRFLPDNVLLSMFNEGYQQLYLKKVSRPTNSKLLVQFGAAVDSLPTLRILSPVNHATDWHRLERTARGDSLVYWLTDSALIKSDSISIEMRYQRLDSTEHITWTTDTIAFSYRKPAYLVKQEEQERKERAKLQAELQQLLDKQAAGKDIDTEQLRELEKELEVPVPVVKVEPVKKGTLEVTDTLKLKFDAPLASIDPAGMRLEMKRDTLWQTVPDIAPLQPVNDFDLFTYYLPATFTPDSTYRFTVDSLAVASVYGLHNATLSFEFKIRALEEYANLRLKVNVTDSAFVDLLDSKGAVVRTIPVAGGTAVVPHVIPGTYYLRLTLDRTGNGRWDTGNYALHLQPEDVYYYPKAVKLRRNWDVDQQWNIYETALDMQKPEAIRKNKPEKRKNALEPDTKKKNGEEEEEDDEFNSRGFGRGTYSGDKYRDYQNRR